MDRRTLLKTVVLGAAALVVRPGPTKAAERDASSRLAALERQHGGRLGVAMLDTGSGRRAGHRANERFLMCSTHTLLTVGAVLARVDRGEEKLDRRIVFGKNAVLAWAPITRHRVGAPGMTVAGLCEAAITVSDNTADNLLLAGFGGPPAVTAFARTLGDPITRLDRFEPELNDGAPGDLRDTTTPHAMLGDLQALTLGNALSPASREKLVSWLRQTRTGLDQLRSGVPASWQAGDKTGSGPRGENNDIAVFWPPQRKPLLVTAFYVNPAASAEQRRAVLAEVGRIAATI